MKILNKTIEQAKTIQDYLERGKDYKKEIEEYFSSISAFPSSNDDIDHHNHALTGWLFLYRYLSKLIYGKPPYLRYDDHPIITLLENEHINKTAKEMILKDLITFGIANIGVKVEDNFEKNILNYLISTFDTDESYHDTDSQYRQFFDIIISNSLTQNLTKLLKQLDSEGQTLLAKAVEVNDDGVVNTVLNLDPDPSFYMWNNKTKTKITLLSEAIKNKNNEIIKSLINAPKYKITLYDVKLLMNYMNDNIFPEDQLKVNMFNTLLVGSFKKLFSKKAFTRHYERVSMRVFNKQKPLLLQQLLDNYIKPELPGSFEQLCNRLFRYYSSSELNNFKRSATPDAQELINQFIAKHKRNAKKLMEFVDGMNGPNDFNFNLITSRDRMVNLTIVLIGRIGWEGYQHEIDGETTLYKAIKKDLIDVVVLLLEAGTDPNIQNNNNDSNMALHLAVENQELGIVKMLLANGADPSIKNSHGKTPLDIAKDKNYMDIINIINILNNPSTNLNYRSAYQEESMLNCIIL